jgi:hypothetical protein
MAVLELILDNAIFPDRDSVQEALKASVAAGDMRTLQVSGGMSDADWDRVVAVILESDKIITI